MRIISKEKDYYDYSSGGLDYDSKPWVRTPQFLEEHSELDKITKQLNYNQERHNSFSVSIKNPPRSIHASSTVVFNFGYIIFCGEIHPFIQFCHPVSFDSVTSTFYDAQTLIKYIEKIDKTLTEQKYSYSKTVREKIHFWFMHKRSTKVDQFLINEGVPYAAYSERHMNESKSCKYIINPILKDYDFFRVYDPFTCHQMVEQYVNNQLVAIDEPKEFNDMTKIESHGFDKVTSFRKGKQK